MRPDDRSHAGPAATGSDVRTNGFEVRTGRPGDAATVLRLFDDAVVWLGTRGGSGQWGTKPFSARPSLVARVGQWAASGGLRLAIRDGRVVGAVVVGAAPDYAPAAVEPELYVEGLVAGRDAQARGAGRFLLTVAETEARAEGVALLRVDCYAGNDGRLVAFYESAGFTRTETFSVGEWPGQVLVRRL